MMEEVEAGRVEAIIVKDMSHLGRDYLKVGQVMEILRQRGVHLIAINDSVDTAKGDNDMTPFLNVKLTDFSVKKLRKSRKFDFLKQFIKIKFHRISGHFPDILHN